MVYHVATAFPSQSQEHPTHVFGISDVRGCVVMADNAGIGSKNPRSENGNGVSIENNIIIDDNARSWTERDGVDESRHNGGANAIPTGNTNKGKRRRSSSPEKNQREVNGSQSNSIRNDEEGASATQLSRQQGHGSLPTNFATSELLHQQQQQQEAAQRINNQMLQAQLQGFYGLPSGQRFVPPNATNIMVANQLRQTEGAAPFLQAPPAQANNDLQQLTSLLQQHLYGVGLAQSLGINLLPSRDAMGGSFAHANPSFSLPSSQMMQGFVPNPDTFPATTGGSNVTNSNSNSDFSQSLHQRNGSTSASNNRSSETSTETGHSQQNSTIIGMSGRPPIQLYITCDDDSLSDYQCLVRKHIELFEAGVEDVESNAQGRNRPIVLGQVGIRCRHCTMLPPRHRARGAIYYPAKLQGIYQAGQNLAVAHLGEHCQNVPDDVRSALIKLRERKSSAGGGKLYWANGVQVLGVCEDRDGLRFESRLANNSSAT